MADAFQKLKNSVNRGITTISVKTSSSFEKTTINTHIDTIKNEIIKLTSKLGEDVYNSWLNGGDSIITFSETLEGIKEKFAEIDKLNEELKIIDERSNSIIGAASKEVVSSSFCSNCGTKYDAPVKFCRKCGNKMQ